MAKFGVYKSLLPAPHMQSVMAGPQTVQPVRTFVNDNVTVRIVSLVGGPPHVRKVSPKAVASDLNIFWLEPVIPEQGPRIRHAEPMKHVDNSAFMAASAPWKFKMKVRAMISRNAISCQSSCTRPFTMGSMRRRIMSGATCGAD